MKTALKWWLARLLALVMASSVALAQDNAAFRQEELDQMLAPVALYPDPLLSQILMASTYPLEVVQASRWSRANPGLRGQDAVRAVDSMDWDPSVKSLTAFPQILAMMDEKIDWTERLGEAFLAQEADVMNTVQTLRQRAEAAGNLRSSEQMRVRNQEDAIYIDPPSPEVVYVPYYDPNVVYGPWWWAGYPPVYWAPPPAYYAVPAYRPAFLWGSGIFISAGFFFGHFDWHRHQVTVVNRYVTVNRTTIVHPYRAPVAWQHDPAHRRGVPFRNEIARERIEQRRVNAAQERRDADHAGPPAAVRHIEDARTAEIRQRRFEARRSNDPGRRDAPAQHFTPGSAAGRSAANANTPNTPRPESRPQGRDGSRPQTRPAPAPSPQAAPAPAPAPGVSHANPQRFDQRSESGRRVEPRASGDKGRAAQPPQAAPRPQAGPGRPAPRAEHAPPRREPRKQEPATHRGGDHKP